MTPNRGVEACLQPADQPPVTRVSSYSGGYTFLVVECQHSSIVQCSLMACAAVGPDERALRRGEARSFRAVRARRLRR